MRIFRSCTSGPKYEHPLPVFKKIPEPVLILGAGVAGIALHHGS